MVELWGAASEAAILEMGIEVNDAALDTRVTDLPSGCKALIAEFAQAADGLIDLALVHRQAPGSQAIEMKSIEIKPGEYAQQSSVSSVAVGWSD